MVKDPRFLTIEQFDEYLENVKDIWIEDFSPGEDAKATDKHWVLSMKIEKLKQSKNGAPSGLQVGERVWLRGTDRPSTNQKELVPRRMTLARAFTEASALKCTLSNGSRKAIEVRRDRSKTTRERLKDKL